MPRPDGTPYESEKFADAVEAQLGEHYDRPVTHFTDPDEQYDAQSEREGDVVDHVNPGRVKDERSYFEVDLIIEGALEESLVLGTDYDLMDYVSALRENHKQVKAESQWEVFSVFHNHPLRQPECECVQYLTDHKPTYVIGG